MTTNRKLTAKSFLHALPFFLLAVFIDQFSKWLVVEYLKEIRNFPIIEGVFSLHYLENRGAVFGIFYGWQAFLITTSILITVGVIYFYSLIPHTKRHRLLRVATVLILSGAIGNIIDRVRLGFVVDFLFFELINFPVFNFADSFVVIACFLFLFLTLFYYKEEELEFIFAAVTRKKKKLVNEHHTSEHKIIDEHDISEDEHNTNEDNSIKEIEKPL
jgi:signal peptidase II